MFNATPNQRLLLGVGGLSLLLFPFVLFSNVSLSTGASAQVVLVSMCMGFQALVMAGLNKQHHCWVRGALGVALGFATLGGTWVLGYTGQYTVAIIASIAGVAITLIAIAEILGNDQHAKS